MNAEDREYLEVLKTPPLSVADEWLIARLEAEAAEVERATAVEKQLREGWQAMADMKKAAEARAEALQIELNHRGTTYRAALARIEALKELLQEAIGCADRELLRPGFLAEARAALAAMKEEGRGT